MSASLNAADGIAILDEEHASVPNNGHPAVKKSQLPTSLFVQHLATYPAVAALAGLAASVPVVKILVSNAVPLVVYLSDTTKPVSEPVVKRATPLITRVDKIGDDILTNVDKRFPQLKTTQPEEIYSLATKPVDQAKSTVTAYSDAAKSTVTAYSDVAKGTVTAYSDAAKGTVNHRVLDPIKNVTHKARSQYAKVYDNQGKALIRSRVDPLVLPLNNRLESAITVYLPEAGEQTKIPAPDDVSNEISRSWRLARAAYRRAGPAVSSQFNYVRELPNATTAHIHEIYEEEQTLHAKGNKPTLYTSALAGLGTCYKLTVEGRQAVAASLQSQKDYLLAPVHSLYKNVEVAEDEAKARVAQATDYIKSFVPGGKPTTGEALVDAVSEPPAVVNGN